mmetsp:Transcript_106766/g.212027  ORF Transcript_106766/g.212027 Transcript_106766/m.212027 type:complete len:338 (-) Transcript_106766:226-1239(-)
MKSSQERYVAIRNIAIQLQEDRSRSSLKSADQLVDKIEELKNTASNLSTTPMENMKQIVCSWRDSMEFAMIDSKSDAGMATGDMAMCSYWYSPKVEVKLKQYLDDFKEAEDALAAIKLQPFQEFGDKMTKIMHIITPFVKDLHGLPDKLRDIADQVSKNGVQPTPDTESMKTSFKTDSEIDHIFRLLERCQSQLPADLVEATKLNYYKVSEFFRDAGSRIKDVFAVPAPCCFMSDYVMDQPHVVVIELNKHTQKAMKRLDEFSQLLDLLESLQQTLIDLDVKKISSPVKQFTSLAKLRVQSLDEFMNANGVRPVPGDEVDDTVIAEPGTSCSCFRSS